MKRILTLLLSTSLFPLLSMAQNVGVDVATPEQKLDVAGGIKIGNTANGVAGSIRWDGTNIQYHDGTNWVNLVANSDNQTLSIALNQLAITGGNSVDLSPYLDNTDQQNLGLTGTSLSISGGTGVDLSPLQNQLIDDDSDTKVQVEESPDEDRIRFDVAGNERWVMTGSRLENSGTGGSVFVGANAGASDDLANRRNTAFGENALLTNTSGSNNVAVGNGALVLATSSSNTAVGRSALGSAGTGGNNTALGADAGSGIGAGQQNVMIGSGTGLGVVGGSENTMLGDRAGRNAGAASSGNVFLGHEAGFSETGNNKLYIDNSNAINPLIYGDFADNILQVNGTLNVNGAYDLPTTDGAAAGYVMTTDAAGNVTWTNPSLTGDITGVTAGDGLTGGGTSGNVTVNANPDNSTIEVFSDELRVVAEGITANEIASNAVGSDEIAPNAVGLSEIVAGGVASVEILDNSIDAIDINTGAVTTDEILNATILPEDINPAAGSANNVLSIVGGVAAWVDPASINTTLQDTDTDTRIEVEQAADEDYIRMYTSNGTDSKETITIEPADAGTDAFAVGQVGIGTNTPDRDLHIAAPAGSQLLLSRGDITTSNGDVLGELMFDSEDDSGPSSNTASAMIRGTATENHGNSNKGGMLSFYTKQNAGGGSGLAATERMRITQDGLVGITGTVRVTSLDQNANRIVMADANGELYPSASLVGTGLGDNLGNHTATAQLNMSNNNIVIKPSASPNTGNTGIGWDGASTEYKIYQEAGGWSFPYPDLMIRFHTGIKLSAEGSYGGVRIYANNGESQTAQFNNDGLHLNQGWFRNYGQVGLYNQSYGNHWYAENASYWVSRTNNGIQIRNVANATRGSLYHDNGDSFGLLDRDGSWAVRTVRDQYVEFRDNDEITMRVGAAGVTGDYGSVSCYGGGKNGWEGYNINGRYALMSADNSQVGLYNDVNNRWIIYHQQANYTDFYGGVGNDYIRLNYNADLEFRDNNLWDVERLTVNTIDDTDGTNRVHFDQTHVRFDVGSTRDIWFDQWDGNHPQIRPGTAGYGFNGRYNNYWYETYTLRIWRNQEYGFSDSRVKENIRQLEGSSSLDKIMRLQGKRYDLNRETHPFLGGDEYVEEHVWKDNLGFIAQELMEVIPEMVILDENTGYYAVKNYEQMFPVVIEAMKEQQKQIEDLKAGGSSTEIDNLKAEVEELKSMLLKVLEANK